MSEQQADAPTTDQPHRDRGEAHGGIHDLGGDIGAGPASSRGGGGPGPQEVREADEHARTAGKDAG